MLSAKVLMLTSPVVVVLFLLSNPSRILKREIVVAGNLPFDGVQDILNNGVFLRECHSLIRFQILCDFPRYI
jgi:hypothetical protein